MTRLSKVVERLEGGGLSLEESIATTACKCSVPQSASVSRDVVGAREFGMVASAAAMPHLVSWR